MKISCAATKAQRSQININEFFFKGNNCVHSTRAKDRGHRQVTHATDFWSPHSLMGGTDKQGHVLGARTEICSRWTVQACGTQPGLKFFLHWNREHRITHKLYLVPLETSRNEHGCSGIKHMSVGSEARHTWHVTLAPLFTSGWPCHLVQLSKPQFSHLSSEDNSTDI